MTDGRSPFQGNEGFILLVFSFPFQKIIVSAMPLIRVFTANIGAMFVDCAKSLGRMKEAAGTLIDVVFAMPEHTAIPFDCFRELGFGFFSGEAKSFSQPLHIPLRHDDVIVRATIAGAFRAIIERFQDGQFFGHKIVRGWQFTVHIVGSSRLVIRGTQFADCGFQFLMYGSLFLLPTMNYEL